MKPGTLNNKNWSKVPLKTLLITPIRNGYSPVCPDQKSGSWVLALSALDGNGFDSSQKKPAPPDDPKIRDFLISKGDFLVSRSNTFDKVGRAALVREKIENCAYPDLMMRFRVDEKKVYLEYLDNYLRSKHVKRYFQSCAAGSHATMVKITKTTLEEAQILLPSIAEQEKIASFLGVVDTRLTQLRHKHELLQTYKRGVMQKLFSQKIRFKRDDGKSLPDWQKKKLGEIASRQLKKNLDESITRVLTNSAVQGIVDQQDYFDKDIANTDNLAGYYIIEKGDYVYNPRISASAPVGPIHKNKIGLGVMSPLYTVFRFKTKEDAFYEQLFKTSVWHKYMCSVANYGARYDRMNITTSDFMALPLPYPILEEQEKIADFLTAIDKKIEAISKQIDLTEQFKKGLLQKMFV